MRNDGLNFTVHEDVFKSFPIRCFYLYQPIRPSKKLYLNSGSLTEISTEKPLKITEISVDRKFGLFFGNSRETSSLFVGCFETTISARNMLTY